MGAILFLALIGVPLIEIAVFIEVGGFLGLWPTLAIIVATAVVGTALLRRQGLATLHGAQREMEAGRVPVRELFDGVCILAAGAFLLTPGFVTDGAGLALMVPPVRAVLGRWLWQAVATRGQFQARSTRRPNRDTHDGHRVIEGEFHEVHDMTPDDKRRK